MVKDVDEGYRQFSQLLPSLYNESTWKSGATSKQ